MTALGQLRSVAKRESSRSIEGSNRRSRIRPTKLVDGLTAKRPVKVMKASGAVPSVFVRSNAGVLLRSRLNSATICVDNDSLTWAYYD